MTDSLCSSAIMNFLEKRPITGGVTQSLRQGRRRPPISQDLEAGGRNMFVRMDLSLKYSRKRNFFHFFEQKKQNFQKHRG